MIAINDFPDIEDVEADGWQPVNGWVRQIDVLLRVEEALANEGFPVPVRTTLRALLRKRGVVLAHRPGDRNYWIPLYDAQAFVEYMLRSYQALNE